MRPRCAEWRREERAGVAVHQLPSFSKRTWIHSLSERSPGLAQAISRRLLASPKTVPARSHAASKRRELDARKLLISIGSKGSSPKMSSIGWARLIFLIMQHVWSLAPARARSKSHVVAHPGTGRVRPPHASIHCIHPRPPKHATCPLKTISAPKKGFSSEYTATQARRGGVAPSDHGPGLDSGSD